VEDISLSTSWDHSVPMYKVLNQFMRKHEQVVTVALFPVGDFKITRHFFQNMQKEYS